MARLKQSAGGFALLEVLVSLLIILLGLLGLAALQVRSQEAEMESYQRAQAVVLLQDIVDRINVNRHTAPCYITTGMPAPYLGTGGTPPTSCTGFGDTNTQLQAVNDLLQWNNSLLGTAETLAGNSVGAMLGARGCIIQTDALNRIYTVAVAWQGLTDTAAPAVACGNGQYGSEARRRVVSATLRIAILI